MIALNHNDITYLTVGLNRFVGFIDGLKEGAEVSIEGFTVQNSQNPRNNKERVLYVQKLTLNGKDYDIGSSMRMTRPTPPPNSGRQQPMRNNQPPRRR